MIIDNKKKRNLDAILLGMTIAIFIIGMLAIYSATQARALSFRESYVFRQAIWFAIGTIFLFSSVRISYQKFIDASYILYGINVSLLVLVLVLGHVRLGAQRWFAIGNFAFQPSEFMKLSLILALSAYIGQRKDTMQSLASLIMPCVIMAIPFVLVLAQPDLGTALTLLPIFFSILLIGGARLKHLGWMTAIGILCAPFFWHCLRGYQKQRLMVFLNPNIDPLGAGYTIIQSKIAIGSGGLLGKGWLNGTQNQLNFTPERHTDFIFSVIGEEWGFFGSIALLLLYFMIIQRAFSIASQTSDRYGRCIATGIAVLLSTQVIVNISMTIGLMPVVGIPLPLVSYGGSSLLTTLVAVGLLLNVGMRRSTF
ncbi:MAG: rod shape-determining protein RodA [Candidatus Omnitrophica bacterium]|nr:rod shape-determining protein RodA [Candidatus Omnitrophota bacterium]MCM8790787.1 rod shape-determining protein RodA [Candidatus Omnitrophota bacterium]